MAVRPIVILGDPVLHKPTAPVPIGPDGSLPADLPELITDMYETMDAANGVGLAANQVGVGLRLFVYDRADDRGESTRRRGVVINPVLETSDIPETMPDPDNDDEGCLSVPGNRFRAAGPSGRGSPVSTPTAIWSPSRATGCSLGCCSTRPDIWTGSSTSTSSSAGMPGRPSGRGSPTAGVFRACRGCPAREPDPFGH